jgi:putative membrane protein
VRPFRLAWFEVKRFRLPLQRAALAFVVLVPLLYGGLYLWSNWDPYGKLDQIPVAVVNDDKPVTVNGQTINAGKLFVDELKKDRIFDWRFVDRAEAARGVHDTDYYFEISVPSDFSGKLASGAEATPQRARMLITLDDANGYIVGKMAQTVQASLENKISAAAVSAYFQSVFDNLESLRNGITQATDGAGRLRDGAASAEQGSASLSSGLGELKAGADKLAPGAQQVADGVSAIADVVVPAANTIANALPSFTQDAAKRGSRRRLAGRHGGTDRRRGRDRCWFRAEPGDRARPDPPGTPVGPGLPAAGTRDRPGGGLREPGQRIGGRAEDNDGVGERPRPAAGPGRAQAAVGSPRRGNEDLPAGRRRGTGGDGRRDAGLGPGHGGDGRVDPARRHCAAVDGRVNAGVGSGGRAVPDPGPVG